METAVPAKPGSLGRVLVVDDFAVQRRLISRRLEGIGCSAELCEDPHSAWLKAVEGGYSAFVVDILFETVPDGLGLIEKLRADSRTSGVPIVALTGGGLELLDRARELGADVAASKHEFVEVVLPFLAKTCAPAVRPDILIVEDDDGLLDLYPQALERDGFRVRVTASLGAAWAELLANAPDAVLLDFRLPDGSGLELCRRIRATPALSGIFVAILTADRKVVAKSTWLSVGADTCWPKPMKTGRLAALLKGLLRRRGEHPAPVVPLGGSTRLDRAGRRLLVGEHGTVKLTNGEFRFLELLLSCPEVGRAAAADAAIVGGEGPSRDLALNAFLYRLRKKFPPGGDPIDTIPGKGFRLARP